MNSAAYGSEQKSQNQYHFHIGFDFFFLLLDFLFRLCYDIIRFIFRKRINMNNKKPFILDDNHYYKLSQIDMSKYRTEYWDVNETIAELSYLTHGYFRYYGKFPSKIGKLIIEDLDSRQAIAPENDFILDNYAGSGTSLVEAKLKNYASLGFDINPFAVLSCKVKTRNYSLKRLTDYWINLQDEIIAYNQDLMEPSEPILSFTPINSCLKKKILNEISRFTQVNTDAFKWFSPDTIKGLAIIKTLLLERPESREREFFDLAFFAIIRRVSFAYDGEVRPHVNKKKKSRNVAEAYIKKVNEMLDQVEPWNHASNSSTVSETILCDNADYSLVSGYISHFSAVVRKKLGLVISHPPYLNCFDYISVYKLKFMWSDGFNNIFFGYTYQQIKNMEIKSYPANSAESIERYFLHNTAAYQNIFHQLRSGGYCCIVIGDCTLNNQLFPVHQTFISLLEKIGFETEKIVYRSTAYGIGQYAYRFRADYNKDENRKKDGILFFKKP